MSDQMSKEAATSFFSDFFGGEHNFPSALKTWGSGWCINMGYPNLSTYDFDALTRLVFLAHDKCIRVEVRPATPQLLKICIWKRQRNGGMSLEHPTLENAITNYRKRYPMSKEEIN